MVIWFIEMPECACVRKWSQSRRSLVSSWEKVLFGVPVLDSKAEPVEEVSGKRYDVQGMVEVANSKVTKGGMARVCH
jgi:hypothetical protein